VKKYSIILLILLFGLSISFSAEIGKKSNSNINENNHKTLNFKKINLSTHNNQSSFFSKKTNNLNQENNFLPGGKAGAMAAMLYVGLTVLGFGAVFMIGGAILLGMYYMSTDATKTSTPSSTVSNLSLGQLYAGIILLALGGVAIIVGVILLISYGVLRAKRNKEFSMDVRNNSFGFKYAF
jgi:hypothetical protein